MDVLTQCSMPEVQAIKQGIKGRNRKEKKRKGTNEVLMQIMRLFYILLTSDIHIVTVELMYNLVSSCNIYKKEFFFFGKMRECCVLVILIIYMSY